MSLDENHETINNGFGHPALTDGFRVEDLSDTQSSSSDGYSDDGFSQESISSQSSVSSPRSRCSDEGITLASHQVFETIFKSDQLTTATTETVPLAAEQRTHPRRTTATTDVRQAPPSLTRQSERKECFVASLVSFAAQFVEAIWPLAACAPRSDPTHGDRGILSLRCFITETLRRSRTSYSTLQVALFYLVLIKAYIPSCNFTREQPRGCGDEFKAMQCGRRMFLTALILASKYLQDRNYSTRAWSKISGLRTQEIHTNEMEYCKKINWALHVTKEKFDRWSCTVLTLSKPVSGTDTETVAQRLGWRTVLSKLNAQLTETFPRPEDLNPCPSLSSMLPVNFVFGEPSSERTTSEDSSKSVTQIIRSQPQSAFLTREPERPQIRNLPTPQSTPQSQFNTFVGASGTPSMCAAMSQARSASFMRVTRDQCPPPGPCRMRQAAKTISTLSQISSTIPSPPESVTSEPPALVHSRGSRSSSVSSSASSISASSLRPRLERFALERAAYSSRTNGISIDDLLATTEAVRSDDDDMSVDFQTRFSSPESWETSAVDSDKLAADQVWSSVSKALSDSNVKSQEWEAAQALCGLRPQTSTPSSVDCDSRDTTPRASLQLARSDVESQPLSGSNASTPKAHPSKCPFKSGGSFLKKCHKRSRSRLSDVVPEDSLQHQVRSHLQRSLWSGDVADRSVRQIPAQSPTQTFAEKKFAVPTMGSDGHKRQCAHQASAADRAAAMLRGDFGRPNTAMTR